MRTRYITSGAGMIIKDLPFVVRHEKDDKVKWVDRRYRVTDVLYDLTKPSYVNVILEEIFIDE